MDIFNEVKTLENLTVGHFRELGEPKMLEVLAKAYFFLTTSNGNLKYRVDELAGQLESSQTGGKVQHSALVEKYKSESYSYKCERDDLKIFSNNMKSKLDKLAKENERLGQKLEKFKEKSKHWETKKERYALDIRELEHKLKARDRDYDSLERGLARAKERLEEGLSQERLRSAHLEEQLRLANEKVELFDLRIKELEERNLHLEKIRAGGGKPGEEGKTVQEGGVALEGIFLTLEDHKPTVTPVSDGEYTVSMKVNFKAKEPHSKPLARPSLVIGKKTLHEIEDELQRQSLSSNTPFGLHNNSNFISNFVSEIEFTSEVNENYESRYGIKLNTNNSNRSGSDNFNSSQFISIPKHEFHHELPGEFDSNIKY